MTHDSRCGRSLAPRAGCHCECHGNLHGLDGAGQIALFFPTEPSPVRDGAPVIQASTNSRTAELVGRGAAFLLTEIDWTLTDGPAASQLVRAIDNAIIDSLISDGLTRTEARSVRNKAEELHLICTLCVGVLKALGELDKVIDAVASSLAREVTRQVLQTMKIDNGFIDALTTDILARAIKAALGVIVASLTGPVDKRALQFVGMISCDEWDWHQDNGVYIYCARPILISLLTEADKSFWDNRPIN